MFLPELTNTHRCLQHGGAYQRVPPAESEGSQDDLLYIPRHGKLDREVHHLHQLAREGSIDSHTADCYVNTYLSCAAWEGDPKITPKLKMMVQDAPQSRTVPDLGKYVRMALTELDSTRHPLSACILQAVPCFKKSYQCGKKPPSLSPVRLNVLLALLLGLYETCIKKPQFATKVLFYRDVHRCLTGEEAAQNEFLSKYESLASLSFMEYVTRVLPEHMPVEHLCLRQKYTQGFYWDRLPLMCDQLRATCKSWEEAEECAFRILEKITRVKRKSTRQPSSHHAWFTSEEIERALSAPLIYQATKGDFQILSHAYQCPSELLEVLHASVKVGLLTKNLREVQVAHARRHGVQSNLSWHMRTHWHLCVQCLLNKRNPSTELKLDTITKKLMCSACKGDAIASIDMVGKLVNVLGSNYVFCPVCAKIHKIRGSEFPGAKVCQCTLFARIPTWPIQCDANVLCECCPRQKKEQVTCSLCPEKGGLRLVERVNHETGRMEAVSYCGRHCPEARLLELCANMRMVYKSERR